MKDHTWQKAVMLLVFLSALKSLAGCVTIRTPFDPLPGPAPVPVADVRFAYVGNDFGKSISMFTVSPYGLWTPTIPATTPVSSLAESLVVDPSGRYVYVPNVYDNTVSMFTIDMATGLLVPMTPASVPTGVGPQFIAADPKGRFVYTANTADNTVSMFLIGANGLLTATSPASVHAGRSRVLVQGALRSIRPGVSFTPPTPAEASLSSRSIRCQVS